VPIDQHQHQGFSWRLLPWQGGRKQFWMKSLEIRRILAQEATDCEVWHAPCGIGLSDVTTFSYAAGNENARGLRVLCLDSDPAAMLEQSASWTAKLKGRIIADRYKRWAAESDATIMVGQGVLERYGPHAKFSVPTNAVWLSENDLASPSQVEEKFAPQQKVRMLLASRFLPWKGLDDVLSALLELKGSLGDWQLDIIGEGPDRERLVRLALPLGDRVTFLDVVPYGEPFFSLLRRYQIALIPTRATEEARIAYDAAASGCVIVHSGTPTLESALSNVPLRFSFNPGNVSSLMEALRAAFNGRSLWKAAASQGIQAMQGRTIDEMHIVRSKMLSELRQSMTACRRGPIA
jgi:glycosyltransferase involved in cell wall biosynthesis